MDLKPAAFSADDWRKPWFSEQPPWVTVALLIGAGLLAWRITDFFHNLVPPPMRHRCPNCGQVLERTHADSEDRGFGSGEICYECTECGAQGRLLERALTYNGASGETKNVPALPGICGRE
jgi:hypothetical protein